MSNAVCPSSTSLIVTTRSPMTAHLHPTTPTAMDERMRPQPGKDQLSPRLGGPRRSLSGTQALFGSMQTTAQFCGRANRCLLGSARATGTVGVASSPTGAGALRGGHFAIDSRVRPVLAVLDLDLLDVLFEMDDDVDAEA